MRGRGAVVLILALALLPAGAARAAGGSHQVQLSDPNGPLPPAPAMTAIAWEERAGGGFLLAQSEREGGALSRVTRCTGGFSSTLDGGAAPTVTSVLSATFGELAGEAPCAFAETGAPSSVTAGPFPPHTNLGRISVSHVGRVQFQKTNIEVDFNGCHYHENLDAVEPIALHGEPLTAPTETWLKTRDAVGHGCAKYLLFEAPAMTAYDAAGLLTATVVVSPR